MTLLKEINYEEKHSKFIALIFKVKNKDEAVEKLKELKLEHKKASHILSCYRILNNYGIYMTEAKEDKEPVSSMKKIASLLEKKDIKDVAIYIVRYFGGIKFGASYLDRVYFSLATKLLDEVK